MIENKSAKYEKSIRIKSVFTQEDNERNPDAIIGMEYTYIPLVDTPKEAFERLHKLTGQNLSEWYQKHFYQTYPVINLDIINSEITDLENFITEANKLLIKDAFRSDAIKYHNSPFYLKEEQYEYLRLTNHYYNTHVCDYLQSKITCQVYGKYILYYNWLKKLRDKYKSLKPQKSTAEFTINEIALKYVYEGKTITRKNGNAIAKQYGHNSGEKLFHRFTYYSSIANRKGKTNPFTFRKMNNKVELFKNVIETLSDEHKKRAIDELNILNRIISSEF